MHTECTIPHCFSTKGSVASQLKFSRPLFLRCRRSRNPLWLSLSISLFIPVILAQRMTCPHSTPFILYLEFKPTIVSSRLSSDIRPFVVELSPSNPSLFAFHFGLLQFEQSFQGPFPRQSSAPGCASNSFISTLNLQGFIEDGFAGDGPIAAQQSFRASFPLGQF